MNKQDCEIVKDLSVNYIENLVHSESKLFIENHLKNCKECRKYYDLMESNFLEETDIKKENDSIEINYLKKIRKHINILKILLILIFIIIIVILTSVFFKSKKISNIINDAYSNIEYMKELDNYKLIQRTIYKDFEENTSFDVTFKYYYKDGKYKIEFGENSTRYLEDDSYNKICVYDDLKQIEYYSQNFIEMKKGDVFNIFSEIINYKKIYNSITFLGLSLKEDNFEGIKCYVIRNGNNVSYRDIWIDKESLNVLRVVEEEVNKYYREEIYTFLENKTLNEDIDNTSLNSEEYKDYKILEIKDNKLYYEFK